MSKNIKLSIKPLKSIKKNNASIIESIADSWVGGEEAVQKESSNNSSPKTKNLGQVSSALKSQQLKLIEESRFTIVIPSYLHTRIKKHCAINSVPMKSLLTEILLKEFPER